MTRYKLLEKKWFLTILSLLLALVAGAGIIALSGNNPIVIYKKLFAGAFGSRNNILQTLLQATPLLFCGLAVSVGMQAGLLNLGVEGQLYMGALGAAVVGIYSKGLPFWLHIPLCMLAGIIGGAAWAFLPVFLKIKRGTHEVVTALMLNYIAQLFIQFMTNYPLREPGGTVAQSAPLLASALLPKLFARSQVTIAVFIGVALALFFWVLLRHSALGYEITLSGANLRGAAASGVAVPRVLIAAMLLSGLCAGLSGAMEVMGTHGRLINGFSPGYGFDGIAVAVLGTSPVSVIFSALLFGALRAGGMALSFGTNLSAQFINTLQGVIIILIAAPGFSQSLLFFFPKTLSRLKTGASKKEAA